MQKLIMILLCISITGIAFGFKGENQATGKNADKPSESQSVESDQQIALNRAIAEITQAIDEQTNDLKGKIRKVFITPSTSQPVYASYYQQIAARIEQMGDAHFPAHEGKKLYGELIVYIPVAENGKLHQKDGGARIEKSSGNPILDKKALEIVNMSVPFPRFRGEGLAKNEMEVRVIITKFKFRDDDPIKRQKDLPPLP